MISAQISMVEYYKPFEKWLKSNKDKRDNPTNAVFKTLDYAHRSKFAYKKQDTFISANSNLRD